MRLRSIAATSSALERSEYSATIDMVDKLANALGLEAERATSTTGQVAAAQSTAVLLAIFSEPNFERLKHAVRESGARKGVPPGEGGAPKGVRISRRCGGTR
jgi:hypothetical protein